MTTVANRIVRLRFSKYGKIRFISHRDVARIWERALRRLGFPVAYSNGFSSRPKLAFGLALPTGYTSQCEYLDIQLDWTAADSVSLDQQLLDRLNDILPVGLAVQCGAEVERNSPSLQEAVVACTWEIMLEGSPHTAVTSWILGVLGSEEIFLERERKGKKVVDDIRPQVHALALFEPNIQEEGASDIVHLRTVLGTRPRALRPAELLETAATVLPQVSFVTHPPFRAVSVCRMNQWIEPPMEEIAEAGSCLENGTSQEFSELSGENPTANQLTMMQDFAHIERREWVLTEPLIPSPGFDGAPAASAEVRA